ncbi:bifunctional serine/threonine-protein kinase/ABC transporter substrate-binding protein [Streptomyces cyaneofuscatus]|uniref:Bifunctional serine/threonine-protein kinase/ABC transporter substrate-binding protein n=1 Tax=Streptomyces cyaneofuscatus TaxID=66883 RepID=A0ABZ1F5F2_9ACTN|nr:bifunctional serine/threonine-protein kinase/ABC transporter substrate-binding protein [Streptomyces cyaneofuscatus]WSB11374.1 bifunctional serine/threonine-protein kinase/ABC transporter substrate-binding protein [Streptomyces cyaneofuscatus]WSD45092.1 bifunctional serine/threonine-protein kinase/ABC transporter substrate-binding protein [Streptomyces cyaneofuscatus]WTA88286.1 bifunctional serine/threonine-protein kinase/ABC transporter substrate-binding protein [Streptomyces cyaneofuscatus]
MEPLRSTDPARIAGYRILGRLGAGGMGVVLLGRSPGGALVAIKLIRAEYADDAGFRTRFRREVAIARQVRNRWAVPVVDADTEAAAPWLATEFVPGPALSEAVGGGAPLPERSVRALGSMLAEALEAVHGAGLVHRDVKPGNVLLGLDGPRLIDFGIARALDDTVLTATDAIVGSPGFLSPEQAQGRRIGPPSDIFSLGCVLVYAATGGRPFGSGPVEAMLFRTVHDPADLGALPPGLRPVVEGCLSKEPEGRPTAQDIRRAFAEDTSGGSWLPGPVTHLIAERSARMLALPDIEATSLDAGSTVETGAGSRDTTTVPTSPGRRRLLAYVTGGAVLAAAGGTTAWLATAFGDEKDPGGNGKGDGDKAAAARPELHIGLQADLSGPSAAIGKGQERAALLAIDEHNARKDAPFTLRLIAADDGGVEARATAAVRRFAQDPLLVAAIGATGADAAREALVAYDEAALPLLSVVDGDTRNLNRIFLCARPRNDMQMLPVAQFLGANGLDTVALVDDGTEYGRQTTRFLDAGLRGNGRTVLAETVREGTRDLDAEAERIVARKPKAVVYGGGWRDAGRFARALTKAGFLGPKIGTQAVHDPRFLAEAGEDAAGWLVVSTAADPASVPSVHPFAAAYRKRFDSAPPLLAAEAYDAVGLIAACAEGLGRESVTRQDMLPVLRSTRYKGVSKSYAFEPANGMYAGTGVFIYRVERGRFRYIGMDGREV